jgi:hypothetical protein
MKKIAWTLAVAALLSTVPAWADSDVVVRRFAKQLPLTDIEKVLVDVPVGEVRVEGWDGPQVDLEITLKCEERGGDCADLAQRVKVVYSRDDDQLVLRLKEWPKSRNKGLQAHVHVRIPRGLPLKAHLGVGELSIAAFENNVDADLGVGELNITLPAASVGSVSADTGIGEANLTAGGRHYESAGLVAREIDWNKGTGKSHVEADCGVGEINVQLTK